MPKRQDIIVKQYFMLTVDMCLQCITDTLRYGLPTVNIHLFLNVLLYGFGYIQSSVRTITTIKSRTFSLPLLTSPLSIISSIHIKVQEIIMLPCVYRFVYSCHRDRNHYRKPQPIKTHSCGAQPQWIHLKQNKQTSNSNNKPTLKFQGTSQKKGYKDFKSPRITSALKRTHK